VKNIYFLLRNTIKKHCVSQSGITCNENLKHSFLYREYIKIDICYTQITLNRVMRKLLQWVS